MIITVYRTTFSRWDFSQKMSIVDIPLDSEYTSEVSTFIYFSNSFYILVQWPPFWCWRNVYCVASLNYGGSGRNDLGPTYWSFKQLPDSISICDVKQEHLYIAIVFVCFVIACLLFCFVFYYFFFFFWFIFLRDSNMISISTVAFRYYFIVLGNLGKP